jgi:hypothetical protein
VVARQILGALFLIALAAVPRRWRGESGAVVHARWTRRDLLLLLTLSWVGFALPQILGAEGQPRDWIYSWYSPRQSADLSVREFAFNHRYKLYRSGGFFDLSKDVEEKQPLMVASLDGEAAAAAKLLQEALDQFKDARPSELDRAFEQASKGKAKGQKATVKTRRKDKK